EIFRAAHTIKGTSGFLGFKQVTDLTHKMEDILNKLRKAELSVNPEMMDALLNSLDILKVLISNVREDIQDEIDLAPIVMRLNALMSEDDSAGASGEEVSSDVQVHGPAETVSKSDDPVESSPSEKIDPTKGPIKRKSAGDQTIRVDVGRLDSLMNLMGELVLGRNSLMQAVHTVTSEAHVDGATDGKDRINHSAASINYITTELQLAVMKMRMLPVGKVFSRFPRVVRDLARESGKQITLRMSGEETELDKSIIEEIGDPLVHLIRNSCDHGIETPEERTTKGKPEQGTVHLAASQEGSNIVIKISDDGRGLNVDAIRDKAVERNLVNRADVDRMPDREVFKFIFGAGFSTAKKVTDVSGRGVGMDVVRTNIEKLNGMIEIDSTKDVGSEISIKIPLTLAIIQGLLIQSDDEVFILPLSSVHETVKTELAEIYCINQRPVFRLRDEIIPIINLGGILNGAGTGFIMTEKPYIVIVGLAEKKIGINIDRFLGQEEVVIKSLGEYLGSTEGVAGATILGDGRIRLIIDLIGLFSVAHSQA
ncbi:MAG: chemotaxis protein CheA, partial [candidate division Zixibacteria bacterium]